MGAVTEAAMKKLTNLYPIYDKIFKANEDMKGSNRDSLFTVKPMKGAAARMGTIVGLDRMKPFAGSFEEDTITMGHTKTLIPDELGLKVTVERKLYDDDEYGIVADIPEMIGAAAKYSREVNVANYFGDSFSGSLTGDGLSLCNAAHTSAYDAAITFDNVGSDALTATSLETARQAMIGVRDDRNNKSQAYNPDLVIVPRALEETIFEIVKTVGKVDVDLNNVNFHHGKYKYIVLDNLPSSVDWWIVDSAKMKRFLVWLERVNIEFKQDVDFNTLQRMYSAYERYTYGAVEWRWIFGNNV